MINKVSANTIKIRQQAMIKPNKIHIAFDGKKYIVLFRSIINMWEPKNLGNFNKARNFCNTKNLILKKSKGDKNGKSAPKSCETL